MRGGASLRGRDGDTGRPKARAGFPPPALGGEFCCCCFRSPPPLAAAAWACPCCCCCCCKFAAMSVTVHSVRSVSCMPENTFSACCVMLPAIRQLHTPQRAASSGLSCRTLVRHRRASLQAQHTWTPAWSGEPRSRLSGSASPEPPQSVWWTDESTVSREPYSPCRSCAALPGTQLGGQGARARR